MFFGDDETETMLRSIVGATEQQQVSVGGLCVGLIENAAVVSGIE